MSDVQQGPDWWLASDGKWYPPQSRPAPPPPPPPPPLFGASVSPPAPPVPPYALPPNPYGAAPGWYAEPSTASVPSALTGWLQGLMWAGAGASAIGAVLAFVALGLYNDYLDSGFGAGSARRYSDYIDMRDTADGFWAVCFLLWIAIFVVMVVWLHKAHKATQRLWHGPRSWGSGWTIGAWFIPLANVVIPKLVINEIERIARSQRHHGVVGEGWRGQTTYAVGWLWWIGGAIALFVSTIAAGLTEEVEATADEIRTGYAFQGIGLLISAAALPLGALFFRKLGRRLTPAGLLESP